MLNITHNISVIPINAPIIIQFSPAIFSIGNSCIGILNFAHSIINAIIINEKYRNILVIEITIYFATKNLIRLCPLAIAILIVESVYSLEKKMTENIRTISQKIQYKMWLSLLFLQSMGVLYRYKHEQEIQQFLLFPCFV